MHDNPAEFRIQINGAPARPEDLYTLARTNYGHFTAMQVRAHHVRGLELHLDRLVAGTRELFASELDREHVRALLRHAVGGDDGELALRVNVFSRALNRERPRSPAAPDVLVGVAPATPASSAPLRVKSFRHGHVLESVKHVGTFPLFHFRRLAQQAGFDDALFVDAAGHIAEGSVWNVGFFDGDGIVWPDAPQLRGVGMQLLQAGLAQRGVPSVTRALALDELARYRAAFFSNSSQSVRPIARIDDVEFRIDGDLNAMLAACYDSNPEQRI